MTLAWNNVVLVGHLKDSFGRLPVAWGWAIGWAVTSAMIVVFEDASDLFGRLTPFLFVLLGGAGFAVGAFVTTRFRKTERGRNGRSALLLEIAVLVAPFVIAALLFFLAALSVGRPSGQTRLGSLFLDTELVRGTICAILFGLMSGVLSAVRVAFAHSTEPRLGRTAMVAAGWAMAVFIVVPFWLVSLYVGLQLSSDLVQLWLDIGQAVAGAAVGALAGFASGSIGETIQARVLDGAFDRAIG